MKYLFVLVLATTSMAEEGSEPEHLSWSLYEPHKTEVIILDSSSSCCPCSSQASSPSSPWEE